nr:zinc finger, CCHC-type, retrotransposon Gag domain protein [Tanacetum cinerariifolium]
MINKINTLWRAIFENLFDTPTPDTVGNSMAHVNAAFVDHRNKTPKCVHFINSIVILSKESEAKEEGSVKPNATEYKDRKRADKVKEEVEEESEEEFEKETKEEEEDDPEYFDTFPTIDELRYQEWILKNPRPKIRTQNMDNIKIKCMIGQFLKKQAYIELESPINVMSSLNYYWIINKGLKSRRKPSNTKKITNFIGRVEGLKMVTTRNNPNDNAPNFEAMINAAVANALPNLTAALRTQITNDIKNGAGPSGGDGGDAIPHGIYIWIERKAYLLKEKQIPSVGVFDEVLLYPLFQALRWLLEEIYMTWAHLEKKETRLQHYTKSLQEIIIQTVETALPTLATTSELDQDSFSSIPTILECSRLK